MEKLPPTKRGRKPKLEPAAVAAAIVRLHGNLSAVAKKFGVDRSAIRQLIAKQPSLKEILEDARESLLDDAEAALHSAVLDGQAWAVCFLLKTQGKSRGYVERQQVEHSGGALHITEVIVDSREEADQVLALNQPK